VVYYSTAFISSSIAMGGFIMQLVGVYRNCICKAGLRWGLPTTYDTAGAIVKVSTDTLLDREAAKSWMICGSIGLGALFVICFVGALHRKRVRALCLELIRNVF
jgi:hypothetical protein